MLLVCALLWLGWQLARQDRELAAQRMQERRESAADLSVSALRRALAQAEDHLGDIATASPPQLGPDATAVAASLPDDSVLVVFAGPAVDAYPAGRLPFLPTVAQPPLPGNADLERVADLEIRTADYAAALTMLDRVARGPDRVARATALMRIARIHRKQSEWDRALAAYDELAALGSTPVEGEGLPANLVAAGARLAVLARQANLDAARKAAEALLDGIRQRHWRLTRGLYEFHAGEALAVLGRPGQWPDTPGALALAAMVGVIYESPSGDGDRAVVREADRAAVALRRNGPTRQAALLLGPKWLAAQVEAELRPILAGQGVAITLTGPDGFVVVGPPVGDSRLQTVRLAASTSLPVNLHALTIDPGADLNSSGSRQRLLGTGLAVITVLLLAGIYLIGRAVSRELAVSRLQSEFVAAVSHEFRTPLSSLCHLSEMLEAGRVAGEAERTEFYGVLARESRRLRRLVDGLLNFGRMEAGAMQYRFDTVDPVEVVRDVAAEFQSDVEGSGFVVDTEFHNDTPLVRADRSALACSVWNLLDNAVKYSPECKTVSVEVSRLDGFSAIRVRDRGLGIPAAEQGRIFEKFVRGRAAERDGVVGTGVGLALVRHIVTAHGGEIRLQSAAGEGSTFTLLFPAIG